MEERGFVRTIKAGFTPKDYEYNNLSTKIYSKEEKERIMFEMWRTT